MRALILLCLVAIGSSEFARYPAAAPLSGSPAPPRLDTPKARKFRTVLRQAAQEGPNFNGHFRLTHWGQGSNVIEWAVIDLQDGRVWFAPEPANSCWVPTEPSDAVVPEWHEVHVDSALFYVHGCRSGSAATRTFDTRYVYLWKDGAARLIRQEVLPE